MTAAICDRLFYKNTQFLLIKVEGEQLFHPANYQIKTSPSSTADYRGFNCDYKVENNWLRLTTVYLSLDDEEEKLLDSNQGIKLLGKVPRRYMEQDDKGREYVSWDFKCDNLDELIDFTGGILIGSEYFNHFFGGIGFPPPHIFKNLCELVFDSGQLIEEIDYSQKMSNFRNMLINGELKWETSEQNKDAKKWLTNCFSWDYEI